MSSFTFGGNPTGPSPAPTNQAPPSGFPSLGRTASTSTGSVSVASTAAAAGNSNAVAPSNSSNPPTAAGPSANNSSITTGSSLFGNNSSNTHPASSEFSLTVPKITDKFPYISILSEIRRLQDGEISQNLTTLIKKHHGVLSKPPPPSMKQPNAEKRRKLETNPNVQLYGEAALLTQDMLKEVFHVADTLYISEEDAMVLYAEVSQSRSREWLEDITQRQLGSVPETAKEHYFLQRRAMMQSILLLCQGRLDSSHVIELTDGLLKEGLLSNLVAMIRKLSELIFQLVSRKKEQVGILETWKQHLQHERQVAVESIFYLTYSTQCTEQEVIDLVDLTKELTNKQFLPNLDPVKDVPDAYHASPAPQPWTGTFTQALPALREKNTWAWEQELVRETTELGDGMLLPTISVLVSAIICSLDRRQTLINRDTHAKNDFGVGNALFENSDNAINATLQEKLKKCDSEWNRKDIWGILSAAYALGLRPVKSVANSPRVQPRDGFKSTWISCLKAPYMHKSFTCLRLTLLPSIRRHKTTLDERCELYEFSMSVLSDFMSLYLDVLFASNYLPHSRAIWEDTENEKLQMRREEQERERAFLDTYKREPYKAKEDIQSIANVAERPDCIDDIMACATALCNRGQKFAAYFWSRDSDNMLFSRALKNLESRIEKDQSLIPTYLSFLSALAMAEPSEVFKILDQEVAQSDKSRMNWETIFTTIRWYVREMRNDSHAVEVKSIQKNSPSASLSTSYYYGVDDDENRNTEESRSSIRQANVSSRSGLKELDEANTAIIVSHLAVITKVASNYATGRAFLVDLKLSLDDTVSKAKDDNDPVLVILFLLATTPLAPYVRGAVFATIASLLSVDGEMTDNERKKIQEAAKEGWNHLEWTQAVPVLLLDQYQRNYQVQNDPKMAYPPSLMSAASNVASTFWPSPDPKYGMVFEMEHIESHLGFYPSTEGMLQLLLSLVKASGCPSTLGKEQRLRTGCAPYIEYVLNFVLPRALGYHRTNDQLPFKSGVDSARLIARALAVVEAILIRYVIPDEKDGPSDVFLSHQRNLDVAKSILGICNVAAEVTMTPFENDATAYKVDFDSKQTSTGLTEQTRECLSLPRPKSPGFLILADILAASESGLLRVISNVLTRDGGSDGVNKIYGFADLQYRVTWARFGNTTPSLFSAKHKQDSSHSLSPQSLLTHLLPPIDITVDPNDSLDPLYWRATGILTSLRILAAAATREQVFIKALGGKATFIPALQFTANKIPRKEEIRLVNVKDSIEGMPSPETRLLSTIAQYLRPICSAESTDTALSASSLAILFYSFNSSNLEKTLYALGAQSIRGELLFAAAVAERLGIACKKLSCKANAEMVNLLLELIRSQLSTVLLGLPHKSVDGLRTNGVLPSEYQSKHTECLSILLDCLSNDDFLTSPKSSAIASKIFQMLVTFSTYNYDASSMGKTQADHLCKRLDDIDFWTNASRQFLAYRESGKPYLLKSMTKTHRLMEGNENVVSEAAWLCDGLAHHFYRILQNNDQDTLSQKNQTLLSHLLDQEFRFLYNAIACLPICNDANKINFPTSLLSIQSTIESCLHVVDDKYQYTLINIADLERKMNKLTDGVRNEGLAWAKHWNQCVRWEHAITHLSSAIPNLIEACFEYSDWILKSGISNLLHDSGELSITREESLSILLDQILKMLMECHINRIDPPGRLSGPAMTNLSNEVLMLVERLLHSKRNPSHSSYFIEQIGKAILMFLQTKPLSIDDEERAVLLGAAMCKLLKTKKSEIYDNSIDTMKDVAAAFGKLSCKEVPMKKCDDLVMQQQSQVSMASRSILCSLAGSFDTLGSGEANEIVSSLACTSLTPSTQVSILQALVQLIPKLDSNICTLLETLSCCEDGANSLIKTGLFQALCDVSEVRAMEQADALTIDELYNNGWVNFFTSNLTLLRSLLVNLPDYDNDMQRFHNALLNLAVSYRVIIYRLADSFPKYGKCWLEIVQSLATSLLIRNNDANQLKFSNVSTDRAETPSSSGEFRQIIECISKLTEKLIQYPFPGRLLPDLPPQLREQSTVQDTWWDSIEQTYAATDCNDQPHLGSPPTGCFTRNNLTSNLWTKRKYEDCIAGAQVMDGSLTILIQESAEKKKIEIDAATLARGICRISKCSQAVNERLREIEQKRKDGSKSIYFGSFEESSKDIMTIEQSLLDELSPLFERICEKLLILSHSLYRNMKLINQEFNRGLSSSISPNMEKFREFILIAISYAGLAENGVLSSSGATEDLRYSMLVQKLKEELKIEIS